jgi:beta-lactamase class A
MFALTALLACRDNGPLVHDAGGGDASFPQPKRAPADASASHNSARAADAGLQRMAAVGGRPCHAHPAQRDRGESDDAGTSVLDAATSPAIDDSANDDAGTGAASDSSLEAELAWLLDKLAQGSAPSIAELQRHCAPELLAALPPEQLMQTFTESQALRPLSVERRNPGNANTAQVQLATAMGPYLLTVGVEPASPHRISGLFFNKVPTSYDEAETQLKTLASVIQLHVAELSNATCQAIEARGSSAPLAIGSTFKLWVLAALDSKLASDAALDWTSPLSIRDELKSLPSGTLQNEPAGTTRTLRQFARAMISVSDNTAADHLIDFVGRTAVELEQRETRHSAPDRNTPWLYTRELFALKLWATPDQVAAIRGAQLDDKRVLLDQLRSEPLDPGSASAWTSPRLLEFEWFANGADLCNVLSSLAQRGHFDPQSELLQTLALNPGVPFDPTVWPYIGYKGGSEVGVANLSWLLRRADGRWFTLVMTLNDPNHDLDLDATIAVAYGAAQLLAATK